MNQSGTSSYHSYLENHHLSMLCSSSISSIVTNDTLLSSESSCTSTCPTTYVTCAPNTTTISQSNVERCHLDETQDQQRDEQIIIQSNNSNDVKSVTVIESTLTKDFNPHLNEHNNKGIENETFDLSNAIEMDYNPMTNNNNDDNTDHTRKDSSSIDQQNGRSNEVIPVSTVLSMMKELKSNGQDFLRVKLYIADAETGHWDGAGIGIFDLRYHNDDGQFYLTLRTDPNLDSTALGPAILVDCRIADNQNYAIQRDSVITWEEGEIRKGLSFVRKEGCRVLWSCLELLIPNKTISISADDDDEEEGEEEENKMYSVEVKSEELPVEDNIGNVVDYGYETTRRPTTEFPTQGPHRFWRDQSGTPLQPPDSCFAVTGILQHLRLLNDPKDPTVIQRLAPRVLREMVNDYWLNALWELLNEGIELQDEECCSAIADLLCHMVAMYAVSCNPFIYLALTPSTEEKYLNPEDPLVRLLSNEHYTNFFRAMEFESEFRRHGMQIDHVDFLKNISEYKDVICNEASFFRLTCQFIYRILYLRDVCLPRHLDEATILRLTAIISSGYAYVCRLILLTPNSFQQLREMIPNDLNAARFLQQLLTVLRSNAVATAEKNQIYISLKNDLVIESLTGYLTGDCLAAREWPLLRKEFRRKQRISELRLSEVIRNDPDRKHRPQLLCHERISIPTLQEVAIEIFGLTIEHSPALLRHALLTQVDSTGSPILWFALCDMFRTTDNPGLQIQLSEIFRKVLDPGTVDDPERDDLLSKFYDYQVIDRLIDIVLFLPPQTFEDLFPHFPDSFSPYFIADDSSDIDDDDNSDDDNRLVFQMSQQSSSYQGKPSSLNSTQTQSDVLDRSTSSSKSTPTRSVRRYDHDDLRPAKRRASTDISNSNRPVPVDVPIPTPSESLTSGEPFHGTPPTDGHSASTVQSPKFPSTKYLTHSPLEMPSTSMASNIDSTPQSSQAHVSAPSPSTIRTPVPESKLRRRIRRGQLSYDEKQQLIFDARAQLSFSKCQICEILSLCVLKHNFRIKYRNFQRHLHIRLIEIACDPIYDQFVALYAIKFLKACIVTDAHYPRLFIRHDVFRPIFYILCHCVPKARCSGDGSIVESAILELISLICKGSQQSQGMAQLLKHIIEQHAEQVNELISYYSRISHFDLFQQLQQQYNTLWHPDRRWSNSSLNSQRGQSSLTPASSQSVSDGEHVATESVNQHWITRKPTQHFDELQRGRLTEEQYFDVDDDLQDNLHSPIGNCKPETKQITDLHFEAFMNSTKEQPLLPPISPRFSLEDEDDEDVPEFLKQSSQTPRSPSRRSSTPIIQAQSNDAQSTPQSPNKSPLGLILRTQKSNVLLV